MEPQETILKTEMIPTENGRKIPIRLVVEKERYLTIMGDFT